MKTTKISQPIPMENLSKLKPGQTVYYGVLNPRLDRIQLSEIEVVRVTQREVLLQNNTRFSTKTGKCLDKGMNASTILYKGSKELKLYMAAFRARERLSISSRGLENASDERCLAAAMILWPDLMVELLTPVSAEKAA